MALMTNAATRVDIVVSKISGGDDENGSNKSPKEKSEEKKAEAKAQRIKQRTKSMITRKIIASTIQMTEQTVNYYNGGLGTYTGDSAYQDYQQRQAEKVLDTVNIGSSAGMGFASGMMVSGGNPAIGLAVAGLQTITTLTSKYYKYAQRHRDYNLKVFKENNAIEYNRTRANINLTNGRLR